MGTPPPLSQPLFSEGTARTPGVCVLQASAQNARSNPRHRKGDRPRGPRLATCQVTDGWKPSHAVPSPSLVPLYCAMLTWGARKNSCTEPTGAC